ncbi:MAG: hypothetical protein AB9903_17305 [Vulcanimicrobiota bacterium]
MEIRASVNSVGGYAKALEDMDKDPEVKQLQDKVDSFQKECTRIDTLMTLPRETRAAKGGNLYDEIYKEVATHDVHLYGPLVITGAMGLSAGCLVAATVTGVVGPQIQGLLALGILVGMFNKRGFPSLYAKVMKKWVLPRQVDKKMMEELKKQSGEAHDNLDSTKTRLEKIKTGKLKNIVKEEQKAEAERASATSTVEEENEYLVVDGVKLKKKSSGSEGLHTNP